VFTHSPDGSLPQGLLGLGLGALDLLPAARNVLAQHMLFGWR
jgi:2-octaprenyl-6-methoxyphenol hydroxylase